MSGAVDHRVVLVPEGLAGERVDIALARMFGLSRSRAAELAGAGHVRIFGLGDQLQEFLHVRFLYEF